MVVNVFDLNRVNHPVMISDGDMEARMGPVVIWPYFMKMVRTKMYSRCWGTVPVIRVVFSRASCDTVQQLEAFDQISLQHGLI